MPLGESFFLLCSLRSFAAIPNTRKTRRRFVSGIHNKGFVYGEQFSIDFRRMNVGRPRLSQSIANIKRKAERRLRAICKRDPKFLAEGLLAASRLIAAKTNRADWPRLNPKIHVNDMMYEGHPTGYFLSSYSALSCIRTALDKADKKSILSVLDFGCGHGRILRALAANFPEAALTAVDTNKSGVNFCAKEFGAKPVYSNYAFSNLAFDRKFDLIWVGSVFTHLSGERWIPLLRLLRSLLAEGGLLLFSTHGRDAEKVA